MVFFREVKMTFLSLHQAFKLKTSSVFPSSKLINHRLALTDRRVSAILHRTLVSTSFPRFANPIFARVVAEFGLPHRGANSPRSDSFIRVFNSSYSLELALGKYLSECFDDFALMYRSAAYILLRSFGSSTIFVRSQWQTKCSLAVNSTRFSLVLVPPRLFGTM